MPLGTGTLSRVDLPGSTVRRSGQMHSMLSLRLELVTARREHQGRPAGQPEDLTILQNPQFHGRVHREPTRSVATSWGQRDEHARAGARADLYGPVHHRLTLRHDDDMTARCNALDGERGHTRGIAVQGDARALRIRCHLELTGPVRGIGQVDIFGDACAGLDFQRRRRSIAPSANTTSCEPGDRFRRRQAPSDSVHGTRPRLQGGSSG